MSHGNAIQSQVCWTKFRLFEDILSTGRCPEFVRHYMKSHNPSRGLPTDETLYIWCYYHFGSFYTVPNELNGSKPCGDAYVCSYECPSQNVPGSRSAIFDNIMHVDKLGSPANFYQIDNVLDFHFKVKDSNRLHWEIQTDSDRWQAFLLPTHTKSHMGFE